MAQVVANDMYQADPSQDCKPQYKYENLNISQHKSRKMIPNLSQIVEFKLYLLILEVIQTRVQRTRKG